MLWYSRKEQIAVPGRVVNYRKEGARAVAEPNVEIGTTNTSQHNFVPRVVRSV